MFSQDKLLDIASKHNNSLLDRQTTMYFLQDNRILPCKLDSLQLFCRLFGMQLFLLDKQWDRLYQQHRSGRSDKALSLSFERKLLDHNKIRLNNFQQLFHSNNTFRQDKLHTDHSIEALLFDRIFQEDIRQALGILQSNKIQEDKLMAKSTPQGNRNQMDMTGTDLNHLQVHMCRLDMASFKLYLWDNNYLESICFL